MFRDTDQGLRSLRVKSGERVVVDQNTKRIKSGVGGVMYGGTFNFPIPFLGTSTVNFDFHHTGAQLSTFFAGPILISDLSKQFRPKFRVAMDWRSQACLARTASTAITRNCCKGKYGHGSKPSACALHGKPLPT